MQFTQHVIFYKKNYTIEGSCVHTPGLKALAETVCTERCIAFNGGPPRFFFFLFNAMLGVG